MKEMRIIIVLLIAAVLVVFLAGCTDNGTKQVTETATPTGTQTATATATPQSGSSGEYSVDEDLPSGIDVDISANVVDSGTILIKYNLDLTSLGTAMGQNGWKILATAYAYNPDEVEDGFTVNSYDDIISAGIPYKTNNIHVFPSNLYPGKAEVSTNPDSGMKLDTNDYYVYGVVLREA
jgi:uncharacterized lipoprotein YehR (DUF1307 family)